MRWKKSFTAFLAAAFLLINLLTVSAAAAAAPKLESDVTDDSVVISGTLELSRFGTNLLLTMKNSTGGEILVEFTTTVPKEGKVTYQFPKILLPTSLLSGTYTFEITGEELASPIQIPYEFFGPDIMLSILEDVRDCTNVAAELETNKVALGIDTSVFTGFTTEGAALFETVMKRVVYDLPASYTSDEDKAKIKAEVQKLMAAYNDAVCLASFESITDATKAAAWLNTYYTALGFGAENAGTSYSEVTVTSYLNSVKASNSFVGRLKSAKGLDTKDKVKAYLYENALLSVVKEKRGSIVKDMMLALPEFFDIDTSALRSINSTQQGNCFTKVAGNDYASCALAADALDAEVAKYADDDPAGGITPSKKENVVVGFVGVDSSDSPETSTVPETDNKTCVFTDMENVTWAIDAVNLLSERNIVNGKGDGKFEPHAHVTRAEFIKMVASAMALKIGESNTVFSDIPQTSWFAPYVAAAYKEGIAQGDDSGKFRPYANITREDMVTMLYRALGVEAEASTLRFTDAAQVSPYAKTAVSYFTKKGFVSGMGDGSFAPKANATRAQAAVIIYNIVMAK